MKETEKPTDVWKVKYPEQVVLVITRTKEGKPNIMPAGWFMPTSFEPPLVAVSIGHIRYTHELISETGEFAVSFPSVKMEKEVIYAGSHSGREVDKFAELKISHERGRFLGLPILKEAVANMECRVISSHQTGDHTIFVGEILNGYVKKESERRLYNLGEGRFGFMEKNQ